MVTTAFQFIDPTAINGRQSRRTIRSHVMKGKNLGKVRLPRKAFLHPSPRATAKPYDALPVRNSARRRSQETMPPEVVQPDAVAVPVEEDTAAASEPARQEPVVSMLILPSRPKKAAQLSASQQTLAQVGNDLSGVSCAGDMTPQSRRCAFDFLRYIGDILYPGDFCKGLPDHNFSIWFQYLVVDEAYFHSFAALSTACMDFIRGSRACSLEYRHHLSTALRLINDRLSGADAVSDASLASVITLCLISCVREEPSQTRMHFEGLCHMIEVRGGMKSISHNSALTEKTRRMDLDLALQLGCATRLGWAAKPLDDIVPIFSDPSFEVRSPLINTVRNAHVATFEVSEDILKVTRLFNSGAAAKKLGPNAFQEMISTLCYRLLAIKPVSADAGDMCPVAHAVHLALVAYMITFFVPVGRPRRLRYGLLARKLVEALDDPAFQATVDPATHLWILVMTGISVLGTDTQPWLKQHIAAVVGQFGVADWQFVRRLLSKYPWVGTIHDEPATKMWAQCCPQMIECN